MTGNRFTPLLHGLARLGAAGAVMLATLVHADEMTVVTTGAFKEALAELAPAFAARSGHRVAAIAGGTDEIVRRLSAGETIDIVIAPAPVIADLTARGLVAAAGRADVARSGIGAAVPAGRPRLDIGSADALRKALLGAGRIALSAGVSGVYLNGLFSRWGIAEAIAPRIITLPGAGPVAATLVRGEADIGFLQVSELLPVRGTVFLGPLPAEIQEMTAVTAAFGRADAPRAARDFMQFLRSPAAAPVKTKTGLEPG